MALNDYDLLTPEKEDELDPLALLASLPQSAPEQAAPATDPRSDGLAKLRELAASRQPSHAAEQAFLSQNQAPRSNVMAAIGAALAESTGSHGALEAFHKRNQQAQEAYRQGLEAARGIDMANSPADQASMEMAMRGGVSPEAASQLNRGDAGLRLLGQGGMGMDAKFQSMENQAAQREADREARHQQFLEAEAGRNQRATDALASREKIAATKKKGTGGGGPAMSPEQQAQARLTHLRLATNADPALVDAYVAGNTQGMDPSALAKLQNQDQIWATANAKERRALLQKQGLAEATGDDSLNRGLEAKRRDPNKLVDYRRELDQAHAAISAARKAWAQMSPAGKEALAQMSGESWASGALRDARMTPEDQANVGAIQALANRIIKETSGAAVSDSEWTRIAREMGLAGRNYDALKGTGGIDRWLDEAARSWARNKRAIESEFELTKKAAH